MFKAVHHQTNEEIISLDPKWVKDVAPLRALDHQDHLLCQECKHPVRLRAGTQKRWHFAHKHKENCTYGRESPELLQARAVLYTRLVAILGEKVTLEKKVEGTELPRAIDCWVEREAGNLAYWIIDSGMKRERRETLRQALKTTGAKVNWVFTGTQLKVDAKDAQLVHLSQMQRDFQCHSAFTVLYGGGPKAHSCLHFLDGESETLTTFRHLRLKHTPQVFQGQRLEHRLVDILIAPKTSEFFHPGERELWQSHQEEVAQQKRERQEKEARLQKEQMELKVRLEERKQESRHLDSSDEVQAAPLLAYSGGRNSLFSARTRTVVPSSVPSSHLIDSKPVCKYCNQATDDWYFRDSNGVCRCNACLRSGRAETTSGRP